MGQSRKKTKRLVRSLLYRSLALCNKLLSYVERFMMSRKDGLAFLPVFIIGPPRSGTTLLYQVLTARYHFAYFTNFAANLYRAPAVALWLTQRLFPDDSLGDYTSRYGATTGWRGPHEGGEFWYRWFPRGEYVYVPAGITLESRLRELRQEVAGMTRVLDAPVIFKNVYNSMRIAPITEALPEACFLVCQRDFVDAAQSILNGRMTLYGNKEQWMGVPPKEIDEIKSHPYWQQVVEQVYYTYQQIEEDKQRFGVDRFFDVHYERLCRDTHDTLSGIERFLEERGMELRARGDVPTQFPVSVGQQVSDEDYERIVQRVNEL